MQALHKLRGIMREPKWAAWTRTCRPWERPPSTLEEGFFRVGPGGGPETLGKFRHWAVMEERLPRLPWEENGIVA